MQPHASPYRDVAKFGVAPGIPRLCPFTVGMVVACRRLAFLMVMVLGRHRGHPLAIDVLIVRDIVAMVSGNGNV